MVWGLPLRWTNRTDIDRCWGRRHSLVLTGPCEGRYMRLWPNQLLRVGPLLGDWLLLILHSDRGIEGLHVSEVAVDRDSRFLFKFWFVFLALFGLSLQQCGAGLWRCVAHISHQWRLGCGCLERRFLAERTHLAALFCECWPRVVRNTIFVWERQLRITFQSAELVLSKEVAVLRTWGSQQFVVWWATNWLSWVFATRF